MCFEISCMAIQNNILAENINLLVEASGLTDETFSNMMGFSLRKLKYMRKGNTNLKLIDLVKISDFFQIKDLTSKIVVIDGNLRSKLLKIHKGNKEYEKHLEEAPTIVYAIKQCLLKVGYVNFPAQIRDIKQAFRKQGWEYNSSSISTALKRMPDLIRIEQHPTKKGTFLYSRIKQ